MMFDTHGARRFVVRGNFEIFSREDLPPPQPRKHRLEDDFPPAHAFFTTFASRPVLMTFGLRIFIPLSDRETPQPGKTRTPSRKYFT